MMLGPMLLCGMALLVGPRVARADSMFIEGRFTETDPAGPSIQNRGICSFITGPREDLAADAFVLTITDRQSPVDVVVRLTGTFSARSIDAAGDQEFTLHPDRAAAAAHFEAVLRRQLADKYAEFRLDELQTQLKQAPLGRLLCHVLMTGRLTGTVGGPRPVSVSFVHDGQYFPGGGQPSVPATEVQVPGVATTPSAEATASAAAGDPSCPLNELAPFGLAPKPDKCDTPECLINFKGYRWWTSYHFNSRSGFYNGGLRTVFAPKNVSLDGQGNLHLKMALRDFGGPKGAEPAGAEAVLMFKGTSGTAEANLGYGDYLVTARIDSANSWATLHPNAAFGVFTYERFGDGGTGTPKNPNRELDLAEISRWGWDHNGQCHLDEPRLCIGNAQFTLQKFDLDFDGNLRRYTVKDGQKTVTLVMRWRGANQRVCFAQYDGSFTLANLPAQPANVWNTPASQNQYVPATNCERFHLNFWFGNYSAHKEPNPAPPLPQELTVTNFQFKPSTKMCAP